MRYAFLILFAAFLPFCFSSSGFSQDPVGLIPTPEDADNIAKKPGYSPYAARNFPTNVYWGDADKRKVDASGKLPPVGNTVDLENATWINTIGDPELITVWKDPDFGPNVKAFYYARVIEIPTPRWVVYDAKRFGVKLGDEVWKALQERAYTSPIWYTPSNY
ncbi:MAG: hypothetical protein AMJ61_00035 [Desulfobacterales bacterium SG8_35_2]|nr:MAG: hypothetical protein AMJ61_00035 [Desulfobacterales bacterium SG8_35_2]